MKLFWIIIAAILAFLGILGAFICVYSARWPIPTPYPPNRWNLVLNDPLKTDRREWSLDTRPDGSKCSFAGDVYHITQVTKGSPHYCLARGTNFTDFAFEVQMTILQGDRGGIVFHSTENASSLYYFYVDQDGRFGLDITRERRYLKTLIYGRSLAIQTGLNHSNLIAIVAEGYTFKLYANKQLIATVTDMARVLSRGYLGLTAYSYAVNTPTEVVYSDAKAWTPPPS
jgi:hypothetical protein